MWVSLCLSVTGFDLSSLIFFFVTHWARSKKKRRKKLQCPFVWVKVEATTTTTKSFSTRSTKNCTQWKICGQFSFFFFCCSNSSFTIRWKWNNSCRRQKKKRRKIDSFPLQYDFFFAILYAMRLVYIFATRWYYCSFALIGQKQFWLKINEFIGKIIIKRQMDHIDVIKIDDESLATQNAIKKKWCTQKFASLAHRRRF